MIPDAALLTVAFSVLALAARFGRLAKAMMQQLLGTNLIGPLRGGPKNSRPPQAVAASA
jgi:hypothetical protein